MAAAAQALAAKGAAGASPAKAPDDQSIDTATTSTDLAEGAPLSSRAGVTRPSLAPPVIPGAGGANRTSGPVPEPAFRPSVPGGLPTRSGGPGATRPGEERPAAGYSADTERITLPQGGLAAARPAAGQEAAAQPASGQEAAARPAAGREQEQRAHAEHYPAVTERIVVPQADHAPAEDDFLPANDVERDLYQATLDHSTDSFLSTLLLATVLVPVADNSRPGSSPGEPGFAFRTEEMDGERFLVVFTSRDRLGDHYAEPARTVAVRFVELIRNWPDPAWSFAVNPGTAVGAKYPGPQVIALANWAIEAGLGGDPAEDAPVSSPALPQQAGEEALPTTMQKAVPAEQIDYYLERGYDRVAGFVHRAAEVEHLRSPGELFAALGLLYDGSPYQADAKEAFVLRWPAFRPSLYRIPYGGQSEQALRAMDGWVIERPPFRGNGFAPGEGKDVIAEFKVDSVRLPHGAELWRLDADGGEQMIATFDCDAPVWRRVGEGNGDA
ncbi:type III secretion system (T3SS) SseB-like protein [Pseudosporangium ferrugineum]|uniref:Type III secretion system (T3SS) SseB-like protein n=2 Tax=Pseudosporangium ferrugineum TaxID=439699 RepID=A0A2T0S7L8_9ACTN|nr:type III secretion system (T3SS) SseB-like protein [Pseudosporangium ferrugineum]